MNTKDYQKFVEFKSDGHLHWSTLQTDKDLLQKVLGLQEEVGELSQIFAKQMLYGTHIDKEQLKSEIGDVIFYATAIGLFCGLDLEEILEYNREKLLKRAN